MLRHVLCIYLENEKSGIPHEKIWPNEKWVKHVYCEWSRLHVLSWYGLHNGKSGTRCSERDCIANAPAVEQKRAADWLHQKWMDEHPLKVASR